MLKKLFACCLTILCCVVWMLEGVSVAQAAEKPLVQVTLAPFLATMPGAADGQELLSGDVRLSIYQKIKNKLLSMQGSGELPFQLVMQSGMEANHSFGDDFSLELMPIVTLDRALDIHARAHGVDYYASTVVSGLNLALVSRTTLNNASEDVMTDGQKSMRLLSILPLGARSLEPKQSIGQPVSIEAKRAIYEDITEQAIANKLVFRAKAQEFNKFVEKALKPGGSADNTFRTYQVTGVEFRSPRAKNEIFPGAKGQKLQQLLASVYTAAYQQANNQVVLPSVFGNDALDQNLNRMRINTPLGEQELSWEQPTNKITLNVYGVNDGVIDPGKAATEHHMYKAWLTRQEVDATGQVSAPAEPLTKHLILIDVPEADKAMSEQDRLAKKQQTEYYAFTSLFYDLSTELAQEKSKN
ncbi:MAG: hypothetical protein SOZ01_00520 [Selenomonadaceae bacterium]|nr:hypothetical protein [Selenomonadaceae bacterium]MDD7056949.1 hypothetical protein [Selenomonadaceae bacterium]MDY3915216.1 hypothetical protein [Selenomonadaceae bacterium]